MTGRIDSIQLDGMLPDVFVSESIPSSDVWNADIEFRRGESCLVEATSGRGKSSMCAFIFGSRNDYHGTLRFNGEDVRTFQPSAWQRMRRENLAYLPQELSLFPELTALQNIELKNALTRHVESGQIEEWLHELGIDSRKDFPVGRMSVGQQQRVGIVRALCQPFDFLLLDEPVSHLDEENNRIAGEMIVREALRQKAGIISTSVGNPLLIEYTRKITL